MKIKKSIYHYKDNIKIYFPDRLYEYNYDNEKTVIHTLLFTDEQDCEKVHGSIMTIEVTSPYEDIIAIKAYHNKNDEDEKGKYPLEIKKNINLKLIESNNDFILLNSGVVFIKFYKKPFKMELYTKNGPFCKSEENSIGYLKINNNEVFSTEKFLLNLDECIYGLGERYGKFVKNGQSIIIWNEDAGTDTDKAYKNIPFYLSNKSYGLFVNSTDKVEYEIGTEEVNSLRFTVPGNEIEYFIIYGSNPREIIKKYTNLTGHAPLIPDWAYGLWLTSSFTTTYNEKVLLDIINKMYENHISIKVFHFDCYWMKERHWCDFEWDKEAFPEPEVMINKIKEKGIKICLWINPYISILSSVFQECKDKGYLLKNREGDIYHIDWWQPGNSFFDFTNPEACKWYKNKLKKLLDMGIDSFKTDFGESTPIDAVFFDGSNPRKMHNYYSYLYNKLVFELLEEVKGKNEAIVFARSATACSQRFPVHWGGDCYATYNSMAAQLRAGLSLSISGFSYWAHDIGGFFGKPNPDLYKRWVAFGLLSPLSRLHGNSSFRVPWEFDDESVEILRYFTELRHSLLYYLYTQALIAHIDGYPLMRPMFFEFPDDPACSYLDMQYMLGESLLIAPVFSENGIVEYYLPKGIWTNLLSGKIINGGLWIKEKMEYKQIPIFIKENSIIPIIKKEQNGKETIELYINQIEKNLEKRIYIKGKEIIVKVHKDIKGYSIKISEILANLKIIIKEKNKKFEIQGTRNMYFIKR